MIPLTLDQIAAAVEGTMTGGHGQRMIDSVCTDSRNLTAGSLFFAISGETFDGHRFIPQAAEAGAAAAVVSRVTGDEQLPSIQVDDTRLALGRLAQFVRRTLTSTRVIAVAGSNGKTGTKALIHAALSSRLRGTASPKSFNNDIGVPVTIFGASPDDDYVVLEIGTNHPGEVEHLSRMSEPDIAVITSIGEEHMEFFKTLDGVRQENAAIAAGLRPGGLVTCVDDEKLLTMVPENFDCIVFGVTDPTSDVGATHASSASAD
jgi:UDP-N-acetylmuramoyl-tripeptide--D-alanyl-D-alanine ligase